LGRFLDNRRAFAAARDIALPMPELVPLDLADTDDNALDAVIAEAVERADFLIIDSPGSATGLSRAAHAWADTLITPLDDSFADLEVLGRVDPATSGVVELGPYAELVAAARESRAAFSSRPMDCVALRNRLAPRDTRNTRRMTDALVALSRRLGFRGAPGLADRLLFREQFLAGLMLSVVPVAGTGQALPMPHVAARQELRARFDALRLAPRNAEPEARRTSSAARLVRRLRPSA